MPLDTDIGDGADALTINQLRDALDGTYWTSGWDATAGAGSYDVDIASGEGAVDGTDVSTGSAATVDLSAEVDPDDPRKVTIYIDSGGVVQYTAGDPTPPAPSDEVRFRTYDPAPPANVTGVVVAEVWLGAGAAEVVSADIRDRRVSNEAVESLSGVSVTSPTDISGSRDFDTVYTNTTGSTIFVSISVDRFGISNDLQVNLEVDGVIVSQHELRAYPDSDQFESATLHAMVPDGVDYKLNDPGDANELLSWVEQELI